MRERAGARRYSAAYKARILQEYDRLDKASKSALMHREGLYSSSISSWRTAREQALGRPAARPKADPRDKKIDALQGRLSGCVLSSARPRQVIEVQGKLFALLDQLATSSETSTPRGEQ
ncbi:hypothetical protein [Nonomuraea sp. NPDC049709]|uniref:hypothetical protein n=1 Tax=Nonomuraea sp. NPDC049709 TaxID=3154736 RepID=UPI00342EAC3F